MVIGPAAMWLTTAGTKPCPVTTIATAVTCHCSWRGRNKAYIYVVRICLLINMLTVGDSINGIYVCVTVYHILFELPLHGLVRLASSDDISSKNINIQTFLVA